MALPAGLRRIAAAARKLRGKLAEARREAAEKRQRSRRLAEQQSSVGIASWNGAPCALGLHWRNRPPNPAAGPPLLLSWRGMHAAASDPLLTGLPPLAAVIAEGAGIEPGEPQWEGATVLAVDAPAEEYFWAAVLYNGMPTGSEILFRDRDTLVSWAQQELAGPDVSRMVAVGEFHREINVRTPIIGLTAADHVPGLHLPVFRPRRLPRLLRLAVLLAAVGAAVFVGWRAAAILTARQTAQEDEAMVLWEQPLAEFGSGCAAELRKSWPRPPGWKAGAAGCVAAGMTDTNIAASAWPGDGAAYHAFTLAPNHNGALARAAAEFIYRGWDGVAAVSGSRIVLQRRFPLRRILSGDEPTPPLAELTKAAEIHFLGLAEINTGGGWITLQSEASIPTLLSKLIELDKRLPLSLRSLSHDQTGTKMEIEPRRRRLGPPPG